MSSPGRRLSNKELAWATMGSRDFLDAPTNSVEIASSSVVPNGNTPHSPAKASMSGTRSSALKDFARQCSDGVEIDPKELGILFNTRAKTISSHMERCAAWRSTVGRWGGTDDGNPNEELSRIFPESTKEEFFFDSQSSESSFGDSEEADRRKWNTPFRRHSALARSVMFLLKFYAICSCAFVMAAFSVEPVCISTTSGTPFERVFSTSHGLESFMRITDFLFNCFYFFLALVNIFLIGSIDRRRAEELVSVRDVLRKHRRSPTTWLDLVAFIGFVGELVHLGEAVRWDRQFTGAQWFSLLQLCKAWRLILPEAQVQIHRITLLEGIGRLFLTTAFLSHMIACILLAIGNQEASQGDNNWIDTYWLNAEVKCGELYFETFYFAALSLTSVGYGDILVTPLEHGINGFLLLCTQLFTAKVCADLTWLTSLHNYWEAEHQARRAQTWASLQNMNVPNALSQRVLAYQSYMATVHREDLDQPIFQNLSENLIQELRLCAYRKLVLQAPFLREQPKEVIAFVVGSLKDEVFLPADFVLRFGDRGRELFFVRRGSLVVYMGAEAPVWGVSNEVAWYGAGNYFGELAMLTGRPRAAWIMATTYCVISQLPYTAVEALSVEHPSSFSRLVQSMIKEYDLRATLTWDDVAERMQAKYCFLSTEEAYNWCCTMGQELDIEDLTAKAFDRAMMRLKVPPLDTKIFWAELDVDSDGTVSVEEFECRITEEMISRPIRRPNRNMTGVSDAWRSQASSRKREGREEDRSEFQSSEAAIEVKATPSFLPGAPVDEEDMPDAQKRKDVISLTQDRYPLSVVAHRDPRRDSTSLDSPLARERAAGNIRNTDAASPTNTATKFADPSPSNSGKSLQSPIPSRECRSPQPQGTNMEVVDQLLTELHEGFERAQRAANALRELHLSASMASTSLT